MCHEYFMKNTSLTRCWYVSILRKKMLSTVGCKPSIFCVRILPKCEGSFVSRFDLLASEFGWPIKVIIEHIIWVIIIKDYVYFPCLAHCVTYYWIYIRLSTNSFHQPRYKPNKSDKTFSCARQTGNQEQIISSRQNANDVIWFNQLQ